MRSRLLPDPLFPMQYPQSFPPLCGHDAVSFTGQAHTEQFGNPIVIDQQQVRRFTALSWRYLILHLVTAPRHLQTSRVCHSYAARNGVALPPVFVSKAGAQYRLNSPAYGGKIELRFVRPAAAGAAHPAHHLTFAGVCYNADVRQKAPVAAPDRHARFGDAVPEPVFARLTPRRSLWRAARRRNFCIRQ